MQLVDVNYTLHGLPEFREAVRSLPVKMAQKVLPAPLRKGGRVIAREASRKAPVLDTEKRGGRWMLKPPPKRIQGLVRRSLRVIPSKLRRKEGNVGVFVTVSRVGVRRTRGESRDAFRARKSISVSRRKEGMFSYLPPGNRTVYRPNDPFYFKFLEKPKNHIKTDKYQFITPTASTFGQQALQTVVDETVKTITRWPFPTARSMKAAVR